MGWCRKFTSFMKNEKEIWSRPHQWLSVAQGSTFIAGPLILSVSRVLVPITELHTWSQRTQPEVAVTSLRCVADGSGCSPPAVSLCKPLLLCCHARWCRQCMFGGKLSPKLSSWHHPATFHLCRKKDWTDGEKRGRGKNPRRFRCAMGCRYWSGFHDTRSGTLNVTA